MANFLKNIRLLDRLKEFLSRTRKGAIKEKLSTRFQLILDELPEDTPGYEEAQLLADINDEGLKLYSQKLYLIRDLNEVTQEQQKLECFNALSDEEAAVIKDLLARFVALGKEKSELRLQIAGYDSRLVAFGDVADEAREALPQIIDAETRQRHFKQDVATLEGEKGALEYEFERLIFSGKFLGKFTMVMIGIFVVIASVLVFVNSLNGDNVFVPIATLSILTVIVYALVFGFRRRISYELTRNQKKRNRVVEIMNKKNVVFAHHTNFLTYSYKKYGVKSSEGLTNLLKDYEAYKHLALRLDSIRSIMQQTEIEIEMFLREKHIENLSSSLERFARDMNIDDKKHYYNEVTQRRSSLEERLSQLEAQHEELTQKQNAIQTSLGGDAATCAASLMDEYFKAIDELSGRIPTEGSGQIVVENNRLVLDKVTEVG